MSQLAINIERRLTDLGVAVPRPFADAAALAHEVHKVVAAQPTTDLRADVLAGRVTAGNAADKINDCAMQVVVADNARQVARDLEHPMEQRARDLCARLGDDIVVSLRPVFDDAAARVAVALDELGPRPDRDTVLSAGPLAREAWSRREQAATVLADIRRIVIDLRGGELARPAWFLAEADSVDVLAAAQAAMRNHIANLIDAGYAVRLNTTAEAAQLAAGAQLATQEADRAERAARKAAALDDTTRDGLNRLLRLNREPAPS
jgi:hypothetical protein